MGGACEKVKWDRNEADQLCELSGDPEVRKTPPATETLRCFALLLKAEKQIYSQMKKLANATSQSGGNLNVLKSNFSSISKHITSHICTNLVSQSIVGERMVH